jgi:bifunctional DNase/RNase
VAVLVEVKVQSLGLDRSSNTPVLILQEVDGERVLPIWIGPGEASAIAMQLADMKFSRPLTHDLLASVLSGLGGKLQRVIITRVADSTYYAELVIERGEDHISVDARPSDSIAVALRADARIFAQDDLLERASIEIEEDGTSFSLESSGAESEGGTAPFANADELNEYLRQLNPEDFGRFSP